MPASKKYPDMWRNWLTQKALPLWSREGFNAGRSLFHERLSWEAAPIELPNLRLMVQARQIATYCRAEVDGLFNAGDKALKCLHTIEQLYWKRDHKPGWIFSIDQNNQPADTTRDLYAHAFILYAYAWAYKLTQDPKYKNNAKEIFLETISLFSSNNGGFVDTIPEINEVRSQNPHMHLLEAFLALYETTQEQEYLLHASGLIKLAQNYFIQNDTYFLLEFFKKDLTPQKNKGENRVEPGHMFEWSWLFKEYLRLSPEPTNHDITEYLANALQEKAIVHGVESGNVLDAINDSGQVIEKSVRVWPQTEYLRLINLTNSHKLIEESDQVLLKKFLQPNLNGGWIDRIRTDGTAISDHMPASSLYHIYSAARERIL
ncbi:mannose-6-phosphate isomerase [Neokomagataea thailandica NBRC 106555]|uniref:Mannose-6-phosphate isomerase n=2 Tax=Neokomagataea TaxID=1223423 RepID=A0A4Y6V906_9PROT|nr:MULTISPECIES: AGE family epimerase/isomerase [Neokomagataea]QDH25101.1 mannose-6-phosphate isomerase [Neokomagataea tanensis]GBR52153.1 mannose-6-phosphate isomerase [Neokomagataea thailandica NBRC 106555]